MSRAVAFLEAASFTIVVELKDSLFPQLLRIHKLEWMEGYIKAREAAFLNIESAWRGSGLQPFQPQTVI
jgi:hypothetical protein